MTKKKKRDTPEWRQFEERVEGMERLLAPLGATIKSPDRIRDLVTGRLREVDASIRLPKGDSAELITVECRKRGQRADDPWIEQLSAKQKKIGASKTIAVSARGFSTSALKSAAHFGIELRTFEEISDPRIVSSLVAGLQVTMGTTRWTVLDIQLIDAQGAPFDTNGCAKSILDAAASGPIEDAAFVFKTATGVPLRLGEIATNVGDKDLPLDEPTIGEFAYRFAPGAVHTLSENGPVPLSAATFKLRFERFNRTVTFSSATDYLSPEERKLRLLHGETEPRDGQVVHISSIFGSPLAPPASDGTPTGPWGKNVADSSRANQVAPPKESIDRKA
jgi:hypothetical protein